MRAQGLYKYNRYESISEVAQDFGIHPVVWCLGEQKKDIERKQEKSDFQEAVLQGDGNMCQ